ncbi:hypothetical protein HDV57DRAFT_152424 [Trichoderma longibrachiatum]
MSGFEIAGIVLGAFPIAISALEAYRDVAQRLGRFHTIRLEYKKWQDDLQFYKVAFTRNLKQLLLPLVPDDGRLSELLLEPGGDCWKENSIAKAFENRLHECYPLYMQYIQNLKRTLDEINQELAIDSQWANKLLDSSPTPSMRAKLKGLISREGLALQLYKFKLSNSDGIRKRLFDELKEYNDKLEKLLRSSDEDTRLRSNRQSRQRLENVDIAICGFWKKAKSVFQALANAWTCQCQQHGARLLLQHRTEWNTEFEVMLTGFSPPRLGFHKIRVSEGGDMVAAKLKESVTLIESMPPRQPSHKQNRPLRSALKPNRGKQASQHLYRSSPSVTLTCVNTVPPLNFPGQISNLCTTFGLPESSCYGYLIDEDCRYYVFSVPQPGSEAMATVTLDQILRGELHLELTRMQRYTLSLTIASTYLQLLGSPWLPTMPRRVDISFHDAIEKTPAISLDEPHITQHFTGSHTDDGLAAADKHSRFAALYHLGIMLLELCFGRLIEDRLRRTGRPVRENDSEEAVHDIFLAALEWLGDVNDEAGPAYADAVSWCLTGNRCAAEEKWRQDMLDKVIQPLKLSRDFLVNGGIEE